MGQDIAIGRGDNAPRAVWTIKDDQGNLVDLTGTTWTLTLYDASANVLATVTNGANLVLGASTITWIPSTTITAALRLGRMQTYRLRRTDSEIRYYVDGMVEAHDGAVPASLVTAAVQGPQGSKGADGASAIMSLGTLSDGATINWDMGAIQCAQVTLAGNRTFAAPTNFVDGQTYLLFIKQDATGSRTATFNAAFNFGVAGAPTLSAGANKIDIITCVGRNGALYCVAQLGF